MSSGSSRSSSASWSGSRSRTRPSGYGWGGPFNYVTANYLHGADLAYYVGGVVAAVIYVIGARKAARAEG